MSVNLTGKGTGLARKLYIFLSIYLSIYFFLQEKPTQCNTYLYMLHPMQHMFNLYSLWSNLAGEFVAVIANSEPFLHFTTTLTHIVLSLNLQIFPALKPACYLPPFTSSLCWWLISDHTHAVLFTQTLISAWYICAPKSTHPRGRRPRGALWIQTTVKWGTQRFEHHLSQARKITQETSVKIGREVKRNRELHGGRTESSIK